MAPTTYGGTTYGATLAAPDFGQENRQVANPYPAPNPWDAREESAFQALQRAFAQSAQTPAYSPPPGIMLPKLNLGTLALLGLVGAADPTKTVIPGVAQGFLQGGMMNSQNEAQRRQAVIEAARQAEEMRIRSAQLEYQRVAGQADDARKAELMAAQNAQRKAEFDAEQAGLTERAKIMAGSRENVANIGATSRETVADLNAGQKSITDLLAIYGNANVDGPSRANAAIELRNRKALNISDQEIEALRAWKPLNQIKGEDLQATRDGRIKDLLASGKGKEAHAEFEKSRTAYQNIVNQYAPEKIRAEIKDINSRITKNLAQANNSLAAAAKSRAAIGAKGPTAAQQKYLDKEAQKAQSAIDELESSAMYLDKMEAAHRADLKSADPTIAAQAQSALNEVVAQKAYLAEKLRRAKAVLAQLPANRPVTPLLPGSPPRDVSGLKGPIGYGAQNEGGR